MEYIAISNNKAINSTPQILVVEVKDTDELIDKKNIEYIQNTNSIEVALAGDYEIISDSESAEVNDMLQYWGSIHMYGTEYIPEIKPEEEITSFGVYSIEIVENGYMMNELRISDYNGTNGYLIGIKQKGESMDIHIIDKVV